VFELQKNINVGVENFDVMSTHKLECAIDDVRRALELEPDHVEAKLLYKRVKTTSSSQEQQKSKLSQGEFLLVFIFQ